jgi:hypothetical protein
MGCPLTIDFRGQGFYSSHINQQIHDLRSHSES